MLILDIAFDYYQKPNYFHHKMNIISNRLDFSDMDERDLCYMHTTRYITPHIIINSPRALTHMWSSHTDITLCGMMALLPQIQCGEPHQNVMSRARGGVQRRMCADRERCSSHQESDSSKASPRVWSPCGIPPGAISRQCENETAEPALCWHGLYTVMACILIWQYRSVYTH